MSALAALLALALQAPPVAAEDEKAVRGVLAGLLRELADGDEKAFAARFDPERLIDEVYAQAGFDPKAAAGRRLLGVAAGAGLGQIGRQFAAVGGLGELRHVRLGAVGAGPDVEASCLLKDADGAKERYRFWFARSGAVWRIYDFESVHDGIRLSVTMAAFVNEKGFDPAKTAALRAVGPLIQKLSGGLGDFDVEEALRNIEAVDVDALPAGIGGLMESFRGALLSGSGREEEALAVYDRAVRRAPDLARTHQLRWETCVALDLHAEAAVSAREFLRIIGEDSAAYAVLGRAHEKLGKPDDAEAAYRKGIAADADDGECRFALGLLIAPRRHAEAGELLAAAIGKAEDPAERYLEAAEALAAKDACVVLLAVTVERAKQLPTPDPDAGYFKGLALRRLGKPAEAEPVLRAALKADVDEERPGLRRELACTLGQLGRFDEARAIADEIREAEATPATFVDAFLHALEGKDALALEDLREALEEDPDLHVDVAREPAFAKLREGKELPGLLKRAKAAAAYVDQSVDYWFAERWEPLRALAAARVVEAPDDVDARYHLGLSLRQLGRHAEAEKALKEGLEKADDDGKGRFREELGQALARGGKPAEALEQAALLLKDELWLQEGLYVEALAHVKSGKTDLALKSLERLFLEDEDQVHLVEVDDAFAEFRKGPEYAALLRRVREKRKEDQ